MIEFVGQVPFLGESHYGLPWKPCVLNLAQTDLFYDNFISHSWCSNKLYGTHSKLSLVQCNLNQIRGCKVYMTF